ncbi:MAG: cadherin-like domain-containing protein, partial [Deltaproteobacteria bacterium]|nr:cadherin-like domain-containing protein [Deltaproteobacteria bacterium]
AGLAASADDLLLADRVAGASNKNIGGNAGQGAVYVYYRNQGGTNSWGQVQKLAASNGTSDDSFGLSAAVNGGDIVIGACNKQIGGHTGQGAAYAFINHAPVAVSQNLATKTSSTLAIILNATDAEGDALTYTIVTNPTHGTLSGSTPNLIYTPTAGYVGLDNFTWKANDGLQDSNLASVNILVTPLLVDGSTGGDNGGCFISIIQP